MAPEPALAIARRVLSVEARALDALGEALDAGFERAVDVMAAAKGRIVVAGMGKSGHVARKIAATLASTGTPAQFVHPAEASHGDLGMVTAEDVALVLSNSGETPELSDLIAHTRRFSIPLIAVASKPRSTLMRAADVALALPEAPEACPMGLAPTTSTTMTLALGDALAVALMARRDFRPEAFRMLHPGGTLGARLATVGKVMRGADQVPLVEPDTPMVDVLLTMARHALGVTGVKDAQGRLIGVISDGDVSRASPGLMQKVAGDVMSSAPKTIRRSALLEEAVAAMNRHRITMLFVAEPGEDGAPPLPEGALHIHDCLAAGAA